MTIFTLKKPFYQHRYFIVQRTGSQTAVAPAGEERT